MSSPVQTTIERDPAARHPLEVVLAYPGFHARQLHRVAHTLQRRGVPVLPRLISHASRMLTGIEIHPGATIGNGLFIDHGMGVVIGETSEIGEGVTLYPGVTLGGTSLRRGQRNSTPRDHVTVGVNAVILGAITIGENSRVGAGSVVVKDVPSNATVVGIPARVVLQDGRPVHGVSSRPQVDMPDPNAQLIAELSRRIEDLERRLAELTQMHVPKAI